jgi:hypothetical protein
VWVKARRSALFSTDSWVDPEGATVNVREKELARKTYYIVISSLGVLQGQINSDFNKLLRVKGPRKRQIVKIGLEE